MPADFNDLLTTDSIWWKAFAAMLALLDDLSVGQLAAWPVDDFVQSKRYVRCPLRGSHRLLTECWSCWCDVTYGYATASDVLAAGDDPTG